MPSIRFDVRYFAGSKLCYAHLRLADHTRSSVFHDAPGLLRIEQPVISAYLEHAWETGMPLAIQSAAAAAMSEFVAPHLERLRERSELFSASPRCWPRSTGRRRPGSESRNWPTSCR